MAGITTGTPAHTSPIPHQPGTAAPCALYRVPATTRTRRLAGVCLTADALLAVYSARTAGTRQPVALSLQEGSGERLAHLTPTQAHALGCALIDAAAQGGSQ